MNRKIKFRVWNGLQMEYNVMAGFLGAFYVPCLDEIDKASMSPFNTLYLEQTPVMQFTGFKDKEGNDIYEGDILRYKDGDVSHHLIEWDEKAGRWWDTRLEDGDSATGYYEFDFFTDAKIIGNKFQNPLIN